MIINFIEARKILLKSATNKLKGDINKNAPMMSLVQKIKLFEGDKMSVLNSDGELSVTEFQRIESSFSLTDDEIKNISEEELQKRFEGVAKDMANQVEVGLFNAVHESTNKTGNIVNANKGNFLQSFLEALEMIMINFEDDDINKPIMPTIVMPPEMTELIEETIAKQTEKEIKEYNDKYEKIMKDKYTQYIADLESRKIIN